MTVTLVHCTSHLIFVRVCSRPVRDDFSRFVSTNLSSDLTWLALQVIICFFRQRGNVVRMMLDIQLYVSILLVRELSMFEKLAVSGRTLGTKGSV